MFKPIKALALVALASFAVTGSAQARTWGGLDHFAFNIQNSAMGEPVTFVFAPKKGKYEFKELRGGPIKVRLKAEGYRRSWITEYGIYLGSTVEGKEIATNGVQKGYWERFDKKVSLKPTRSLLKSHEAKALKLCQQHGKANDKVVKELPITFAGSLRAEGKNLVGSPGHPPKLKALAYHHARVVCMPEPFEVKDVDVSVNYKGGMQCPKEATLNVKFTTNKPGKHKIEFMLVRGDGAKQWNTAYTFGSGDHSIAVFHKNYTFKKSTSRKYMVIVKGSPISSSWEPMKVTCGTGGGGFKAAPTSNNNY